MTSYVVGGLTLTTDLELPEVPRATTSRDAAWHVRHRDGAPVDQLPHLHDITNHDGSVWAHLSGDGATYRLSFPGLASFTIDTAARTVDLSPEPAASNATVRHLLLDQVVPHLLSIDGSLVLHAATIGIAGRAVALMGPTGSGKSSLAAAFVRHGASLLGDDFLLLRARGQGFDAVPAYPGLRLWPDAADELAGDDPLLPVAQYTGKVRWHPGAGAVPDAALPLAAIVALGHPEPGGPPCAIGPLRGQDAFMTVYQQSFRMERAGRERQAAELDRFTTLATTVPVLLLEHERRFDLLPQIVRAVHEAIGAPTG